MSRTFYSEYVNHCLRFYARHPEPVFRTDVDRCNWKACETALKKFSKEDREILLSIYRDGDTVPDNVYRLSKENDLKQDTVWNLISILERRVAKCRRLI